jgi:CRISPR-associated endonuclease/helicase Cas3
MPTYEFPVRAANPLPEDCGYALFSALSTLAPWLHGNREVSIAPLRGRRVNGNQLHLDRKSVIQVRGITKEQAASIAGRWVNINENTVTIGLPKERVLEPCDVLATRLVIIRVETGEVIDEPRFLQGLYEKLSRIGVTASVTLTKRRTTRMKGQCFIGYSVILSDLSDKDSMTIQEGGVGWGNRWGVGVFYPGHIARRMVLQNPPMSQAAK